MSRCRSVPLVATTLLFALISVTSTGSAGFPGPMGSNPYESAARVCHVPLELLIAIAGAESGYHPWALNFGGREFYCHSRWEAMQMLATPGDADIGIMQINWSMWGGRLGLTRTELLEPRTNILAGALILKDCLARPGDLWKRIGRYHSGLPEEQARYIARVYQIYLQHSRSMD